MPMPGRSRRPRAAVLAASALLSVVLLGCELTLDRSGDPSDRSPAPSVDATTAPSAPPEPPFAPVVYPADGEAPCDETEPAAGLAPYRGNLRRISAPDARTVVFELCRADDAFRSRVATPALAINDRAWLDATLGDGDAPELVRSPNGTGPFRLERWDAGRELILARNEAYHGAAAIPSALVFRWDPSPGVRLEALVEGSVDGIDGLDEPGVDTVEVNTELSLHVREGLNLAYVGMSNRFAPFDRTGVRRAISLALDRQALVDAAFPPGTTVPSHLSPCSIENGCAGDTWPEQDIPAAKDLLAGAGFADGFRTTIQFSPEPRDYLPDPEAVATELQRQLLEHLDVIAALEPMPFEDLVAAAQAGELDGLHLLGARARFPDLRGILGPRLGSGADPEFGDPYPEIADALRDAARATNADDRRAAYTAANVAIRRHVPLVPLGHVGTVAATRADVRGFVVSPPATERFAAVTPGDRAQFAWMDAAEPAGLYCADEVGLEALRVCAQIGEGLYRYQAGKATPEPALAEACSPSGEFDVWTCTLRPGVRFHDGARLDAADVVASYAVIWDAAHPLHRGRTGEFRPFLDRFAGFLHPPAAP